MIRRIAIGSLWASVVVLSLVGVASVIGRYAFPGDALVRFQPLRWQLLEALGRPDPAALTRLPDLERFDRRFAEYHVLTRWHIIAGGVFIVLAPLQLVKSLRRRHPALHRWLGRCLLAIGSAAAVTGLYYGIFIPIAGMAETIIVTFAGTLFLIAVSLAFRAIRRGDVATHREWMLRAFGAMLAVPGTRVIGTFLDIALAPAGISSITLLAIDLWVTWPLFIGVTEWWVRQTRHVELAK